jgi:hypothetical protein
VDGINSKMVPRNGHTFVVGIVGRIGGYPGQYEQSLDDQEAHGQEEAELLSNGPIEYRVIATVGKGEHLERLELAVLRRNSAWESWTWR